MNMRFNARHIGSGVWGVWDGGVMSWRGTNLGENEAKQKAADLNIMFDQYGNRDPKERREVQPPIPVESATWSPAGELDYWVKDRFEWWGRVRCPDGQPVWIKASDLRQVKTLSSPRCLTVDPWPRVSRRLSAGSAKPTPSPSG